MQVSGALLEVIETVIKATKGVLKKYRSNIYNSAVTYGREIVEALQTDSELAENRPTKKEECLNINQRTKVVKCHKETNFKQTFCNMLFKKPL